MGAGLRSGPLGGGPRVRGGGGATEYVANAFLITQLVTELPTELKPNDLTGEGVERGS